MGIDGKALGAESLLDLWRESGDLGTRDRLVSDHLPLVCRLCRRFAHLGEPLDDLVQVGAIGLLKPEGPAPACGSSGSGESSLIPWKAEGEAK